MAQKRAAALRGTDATQNRSVWASRHSAVNSSPPVRSSCVSAARAFHAGVNVGMGKDHTLFALIDGKVQFGFKGALNKQTVSIVAAE